MQKFTYSLNPAYVFEHVLMQGFKVLRGQMPQWCKIPKLQNLKINIYLCLNYYIKLLTKSFKTYCKQLMIKLG